MPTIHRPASIEIKHGTGVPWFTVVFLTVWTLGMIYATIDMAIHPTGEWFWPPFAILIAVIFFGRVFIRSFRATRLPELFSYDADTGRIRVHSQGQKHEFHKDEVAEMYLTLLVGIDPGISPFVVLKSGQRVYLPGLDHYKFSYSQLWEVSGYRLY